MGLTVPEPTLSSPGVIGAVLVSEKPINLLCGPVTLPDGKALGPTTATRFGYLLFREVAPGLVEVWDEKNTIWSPPATPVDEQQLFPEEPMWKSILVAVGQKDAAGQDKFGTNTLTGFPRYFARCQFRGRDAQGAEHAGTSPRSAPVQVLAMGEGDHAGLVAKPMPLAKAEQIYLFLKDGSGAERGTVKIRAAFGGFVVELMASGAMLRLTADGDILLAPASGRDVRIAGDLEVGGVIRVGGTQLSVP
jgi:hypothetical protein